MGESKVGTGPDLAERRGLRYRFVAVVLGAAILAIDTFTPLEGAIAVLYVLPLLIAAETLSPSRIIILGLLCCALSLLSFGIVHGAEPDLSQGVRLSIAFAAIAVTTALLVRDHKARGLLLATNRALAQSEWRYRSIFQRSRISLWEQDYSGAVAILEELKANGVTDLAAYSALSHEFLQSITAAVLTTEVNDAMVEVLGASSRSDAFAPMTAFSPNGSTMLEVLQAIHDGKDHYQGQGSLVGLDGKERVVLVAKAFPPDIASTGRVIGTLVDVTDRHKAHEALLAAQSELARASRAATVGALSASIAHELNQPLGAIVMNAQTCLRWLRKTPPDVAGAYAAAERAAGAGMRASEIVRETRELLTKQPPRDELVDLHRLVLGVVSLLDREISEHGVAVHTDIEPNLPLISADPISIQQVLVNLVTNALHAMADCATSREISLIIDRPHEDHVRLVVRDRGHGIAEEALTRLFDPFFTTKEGGMGMGLAISRMAVEACGGQLLARNHENGGALFECLLPAKREVEAA